jgi:ACS family hexuronate transporter-like MFS transporter
MLPGAAFSVTSLAVAMFILGLGEAANFPACIRTVAEWFPKRERTLATSLFNSGANVGNMIVPVLVPWFLSFASWRGAFVISGGIGLLWLAVWVAYYRKPEEHPRVSKAELAHILSDPGEKVESVPWSHIFPIKETWGFAAAKFLTDPIWWFYLFWIPPYLRRPDTFNLSMNEARMPVVLAYAISIIGSVGAGYVNSILVGRGVNPNLARKGTMLACVLLIVPIFAVPYVHELWLVVALLGMATAGHQGWSANLFTVPSDVFPKAAVASVTGFGGMAGAVGGILLQGSAGVIVMYTGSFKTLFLIACLAYPAAMLLLHASTPKLAPAKLK